MTRVVTTTIDCEPPAGRAQERPAYWPGVVAAALTTTATVMPGFAVGAFASAIEVDLHASRTAVGLTISAFYAATALGSPVTKRVAARLPAPVALAVAALVACATMVAVSRADGVATMAAVLVAGGLGNGLVQPAAGRLIAARVPAHRRSLAAGAIGAAMGAGTLLPGLLVAVVVPSHGWRTGMVVAGVAALVPLGLAPLTRARPEPEPEPEPSRRTQPPPRTQPLPPGPRPPAERAAGARRTSGVLALWAVAAGLSAAGNNAVATYFVQLGTRSGLPDGTTGSLLSLSAVVAIAVRLTAGALTDRAPRRNPAVITAMMLTGGLGLALVAVGTPVTFVLGAALAFSAGWGWTGLLLATTLRLVGLRAENAGHTVQVGIFSGAAVAPYAFAAVSRSMGVTGAALLAAVAAAAAAAAMTAGALLLRGRQA